MNFPGQKFTLVEGRKASFGKMLQEVKLNERVKHGIGWRQIFHGNKLAKYAQICRAGLRCGLRIGKCIRW
jgi:hypothetical protein